MNSDLFAKPGTFEFEVPPKWDALPATSREDGWLRYLAYKLRHETRPLKEARLMTQAIAYAGKAGSGPESTPASSQSEYGFLRRLLDSWSQPMPVVSGQPEVPTDNRIPRPVAPQDVKLLERTKHVRLKGEKLMQFFARTGLGADQIRHMSYDQITRFCNTVEENAEQQPRYFQEALPRKIRIHFV